MTGLQRDHTKIFEERFGFAALYEIFSRSQDVRGHCYRALVQMAERKNSVNELAATSPESR
jgi:hypothetical protein